MPLPDESMPELGDTLDFMRVIWQLDHALQRTSKRMDREIGVTGPQRLVLRIVGRIPEISAGQLAHLLHVHPSTLTGVLQRLEGQHLLRRRSDPLDGRRSLLTLTQKGRSLDTDTEGTVEAAVARVLARTPTARRDIAHGILTSIAHALLDLKYDPPAPLRRNAKRPR